MFNRDFQQLKKQYPEYSGKTAKNAIDLTGKTFGKLKVLYRTENKQNVSKNRQPQWVCECQCENHTIVVKAGIDLRNGAVTNCGCNKGHKTIDISPETLFNYWKVIKRVPNHKDDTVYYECLCTKCNKTIKEVSYKHLKNGASKMCRECSYKEIGNKNRLNEKGKTYGFLFVNREATEVEKPENHHQYGRYWNCTCLKCGKENVIVFGDYLRNGDTKSCGCLNSLNESLICQNLDKLSLKYSKQKTFDDLISERKCDKLYFDIAIYQKEKLSYLIEYDGIQHFENGHFKDTFIKTHKNDLIKNKYCFDNNIPLIRIPYDVEYTIDDLRLETTRFLLTPENEEEYYFKRMKT